MFNEYNPLVLVVCLRLNVCVQYIVQTKQPDDEGQFWRLVPAEQKTIIICNTEEREVVELHFFELCSNTSPSATTNNNR